MLHLEQRWTLLDFEPSRAFRDALMNGELTPVWLPSEYVFALIMADQFAVFIQTPLVVINCQGNQRTLEDSELQASHISRKNQQPRIIMLLSGLVNPAVVNADNCVSCFLDVGQGRGNPVGVSDIIPPADEANDLWTLFPLPRHCELMRPSSIDCFNGSLAPVPRNIGYA